MMQADKYQEITQYIVDRIANRNSDYLDEYYYGLLDQYVDQELENGGIIKHNKYHFTGHGVAEKWSQLLMEKKMLVKEEDDTDNSCKDRIKGQGVYFIIYHNDVPVYGLTFSWSYNGIHFSDVIPKVKTIID